VGPDPMTMQLPTATAPGMIEAFLTIGLDVGGTKTACVVTDADDRVLLHEVVPTDATRLAGQLSDLIRRAGAGLPTESDGAPAVAAGIPPAARLLRGATASAAEAAPVSAEPADGRCVCGLVGCLEHVAAGPAIARAAREAVASGRASTLGPQSTPTDVFRAAE